MARSCRRPIDSHAAPNNGLHPTVDTLPLIYLQSLGAAGDAGREASLVVDNFRY